MSTERAFTDSELAFMNIKFQAESRYSRPWDALSGDEKIQAVCILGMGDEIINVMAATIEGRPISSLSADNLRDSFNRSTHFVANALTGLLEENPELRPLAAEYVNGKYRDLLDETESNIRTAQTREHSSPILPLPISSESASSTPLGGHLLGPEYDPYSVPTYGVPDHERGLPRDAGVDAGERTEIGSWRAGGDGVGSWDPETEVYMPGGDGWGSLRPTQTRWQDGGDGWGSSINLLNPTIEPSGGGG